MRRTSESFKMMDSILRAERRTIKRSPTRSPLKRRSTERTGQRTRMRTMIRLPKIKGRRRRRTTSPTLSQTSPKARIRGKMKAWATRKARRIRRSGRITAAVEAVKAKSRLRGPHLAREVLPLLTHLPRLRDPRSRRSQRRPRERSRTRRSQLSLKARRKRPSKRRRKLSLATRSLR